MKLRSFRLRIALLAATLAGTALVGFGAVAWQLIYVAKVNRLDAKLENQIRRAVRPRPPGTWQSFLAELPRELGTDAETPTALLVLGTEGLQYQSPQWPTDFDARAVFPPRPTRSWQPPFLPGTPMSPGTNPPPRPPEFHPERSPDRRFPEPQIITRLVTQPTTTGSWRMGAISLPPNFPVSQIAIAVSLQSIDQEMTAIRNIFLIAIPSTLLLVAVGAWALSGSALQPIRRLTTAMQQVTVTGLDQRAAVGSTDQEFVELIQVFNQMLERLERSFKQASRFSADAAHELKTPLAILQGELELALQQADLGSESQQRLSNLLDEVSRLSSIVRKLLLLSLADAGQMSFYKTNINLSAILGVMIEDLELLAPDLEVQTDIAPELQVWGDRDLILQLLQNLISNAIKYNLAQGWIRIQATQAHAMVQVKIANAAQPIATNDRDRIFDRFYRGDPARTRNVEGVGLGLSLCREIAHAHRGSLTLDPPTPDQTSFTLTLPSD